MSDPPIVDTLVFSLGLTIVILIVLMLLLLWLMAMDNGPRDRY